MDNIHANSCDVCDLNVTLDKHVGVFTILTGTVLTVIIVLTLTGNLLVVAAVIKFHRLRNVTNYLLVSLAIADLTVAVLVMPYALLYHVVGKWQLGWIFCNFFISCDIMCCTASILHLCIISLDRYFAITDPLTYKTKMSKSRAFAMIISAWLCSVLISFIPIFLGWYKEENTSSQAVDTETCILAVNPTYAVVSSTTSFYFPLIIMFIAYAAILRIAEKQERDIVKLEMSLAANQLQDAPGGSPKRGVRRRQKKADHKAVKTLGLLMGLFCMCWVPFFLLYVIKPFCPACEVSPETETAITWLGYCNSFVNPCIYACFNRDFKVAFRRLLSPLLCCSCCFAVEESRGNFTKTKTSHNSSENTDLHITVVQVQSRPRQRLMFRLGPESRLISLLRHGNRKTVRSQDVSMNTEAQILPLGTQV